MSGSTGIVAFLGSAQIHAVRPILLGGSFLRPISACCRTGHCSGQLSSVDVVLWVGTHIPYQPSVGARLALLQWGWGGLGVQRSWDRAKVSQTAAQWISECWGTKAVLVQSCRLRKWPDHSIPASCSEMTNLSLTTTTAVPFSLNRHRLTFSPQAVQEQCEWKDMDKILLTIQNSYF